MNVPSQTTRRIGFIRIDKDVWEFNSHAIRNSFSDFRIVDVRPDRESGSMDIVLIHPKFAEVDLDAVVPRYYCNIFVNDDGSVTRGPIISR